MKTTLFLLITIAAVLLAEVPKALAPTPIALTFMDHLEAGLIEQDVFVEKPGNAGRVYRVLPAEKVEYLAAPIFATAAPVAHDPFSADAAGAYPKGRALHMTLGQWLGASGSASYTCEGGNGTVKATFAGLVPEATYTMWHFFMPTPPTEPFTGTLDLPVGARDGSQSVFHTNVHGAARFEASFTPCLQLSDEQLAGGLAIAWHSDGTTYGPLPGDFGTASHVQLFAMLPQEDAVAAR
jgi:hypothetical protein